MKQYLRIEVPRWYGVLEHMAIGLTLFVLEVLIAAAVTHIF
jgi:hypothetical protein